MVAAVETMAYVGATPWHGLGNVVEENISLDEFQKQAGLDWQVQKTPVQFEAEHRVRHRSGNWIWILDRGKGFADQLFVGKGAIDFRGIKEGNSPLHRGVHQVDHFVAIRGRTIVHAHAHTAQPDGGYFQAVIA